VTADPTPASRTANAVLSGDQLRLINHPSRAVVDWAETRVTATLHTRQDNPNVTVTWHAWTRAQPDAPIERLTWQPGTPLPPGTRYAEVTATLHP
jgi:hypothetical protein